MRRAGQEPRPSTWVVVVAVLTLVALSIPVYYARAAFGQTSSCRMPTGTPGWQAMYRPRFTVGGTSVSAMTADPVRPSRLFATNGAEVLRSSDGGCSWRAVFVADGSSVTSIAISRGHDHVYLLLRDGAPGVGDLSEAPVMTSKDGGATWIRGEWSIPEGLVSTGPSALGSSRDLVVSPADPADAYLVMSRQLFQTTDAGQTWKPVLPLSEASEAPFFQRGDAEQLEAHPYDPETLWLRASGSLYRSTDGGRRWVTLEGVSASRFEVVASSTGSAWIYAFGGGESVARSTDGGETWTQIDAPAGVASAAAYRAAGQIAISTFATQDTLNSSRVYVYAGDAWVPIRLVPPRLNLLVSGGAAGTPFLYATSDEREPALAGLPAFYAFSPPAGVALSDLDLPLPEASPSPTIQQAPLPANPDPCGKHVPLEPAEPDLVDTSLTPEHVQIVLTPGESTTIPYRLVLPPRPKPLDLVFLIDTTGSMGPAICGAQANAAHIARRLLDAGIDAHFGLGDFKDYPIAPFGLPSDYPYRRVLDLQAPGPDLIDALQQLSALGGGDGPESHLSALYQVATGDGDLPWVLPDQQMNFRPDSMRLVINMTDVPFHDEPTYPGSTWTETIAALRDKEILQAGLSFGDQADLRSMAIATGAVADYPTDCDGDGQADLAPNDPLVCAAGAAGPQGVPIADPIVGLVNAVRQERPVTLVEATDSGVVRAIAPDGPRLVNVRVENTLQFDVTYKCSFKQAGQTFPVTLDARLDSGPIASAYASVVCGSLPPPPQPPPLNLAVPPIVIGVAPVPPMPVPAPGMAPAPAPLPAPANAPAPAQNPNMQPAAHPNPNPAVATQPQERAQVATVLVGQPVKEQFAHAMARLGESEDGKGSASFTLIAGGLSLASMFGYATALRARSRRALAPAATATGDRSRRRG